MEYWLDLRCFGSHYSNTPTFHYSGSWEGAAHPAAFCLARPFEKAGGVHFATYGVMAV